MPFTYKETLSFLYSLQFRGIKFGLENISSLLKSVGNPERSFPSIHIAGTNGKGSTASFLASILMESGKKTGLYTSPHLVRFNERVRVNKAYISDDDIVSYVGRIRNDVDTLKATFFEATTCIAFMHFADQKVDVAVVETGLGGRLDATNVITPILTLITNISREHTDYLGSSLEGIAREKGGIIKPGIPCVTSVREGELLKTLQSIAREKGAPIYSSNEIATVETLGAEQGHDRIQGRAWTNVIPTTRLGLSGHYQIVNAALALAGIEILEVQGMRIPNDSMVRGLAHVAENTGLMGRLQHRSKYLLDVAHNPAGIEALVSELKQKGLSDLTVLFGVMRDKEFLPMIRSLASIARIFLCVQPSMERAMKSTELSKVIRELGFESRDCGDVAGGMMLAGESSASPVLVTGSFYVVGEALGYLDRQRPSEA